MSCSGFELCCDELSPIQIHEYNFKNDVYTSWFINALEKPKSWKTKANDRGVPILCIFFLVYISGFSFL